MQATNQTLSEWRTCILARDNSTDRRKRFEVRNVVGVVDEFNHLRQRVTQEDKAPSWEEAHCGIATICTVEFYNLVPKN